MIIEEISHKNLKALATLMKSMWPESSIEAELADARVILEKPTQTCFLLKEMRVYFAFAYFSLRFDYVEGTKTSPVAYLEGIYVAPAFQKQGFGQLLMDRGEAWAKTNGCTQLASDTSWDNTKSLSFHKKVGFREAGRIICFVKDL